MDQRVSTAPNPKGRKWLSHNANPGGKFLLRQASGHPSSSHPEDDFAVVDRPQTYPGSRLTPEFHWNLNNSALKTLSTVQVEQLYGLFKFYDSSTAGDALPSINCSHFIEILRDARLLSDSSTDSAERGLQVTAIERIFAQATMGKMRMHLDVNGQPALTFSLFCGALMNCAMVLSPLVHPETALQKMLPVLLHSSIADGHYFSSARGLLSHLPTESLWTPESSQVLLPQLEHAEQDFLELPIFQEVIEDCEEDIVLEELKQEKLAQHYKLSNRLCASFYPDTIAHISTKFRMFDVFDSGTLPRGEVFALLSSLDGHADLPDPHAVLARLNSLPPDRAILNTGGVDASSGELTLSQLLQVVEDTRESKRYSGTAQLATMKIRMDRAASAARGGLSSKAPHQDPNMSDDNGSDRAVDTQDTPVLNRRKNRGSLGRKQAGLKSRKSILGQGSESSSHSLIDSKHGGSVSGKKRTVVYRRRSSRISNTSDAAVANSIDHHENEDNGSARCLITPICSNTSGEPAVVAHDIPNNDCIVPTPDNKQNLAEDKHDARLECMSNTITVHVNTPLSATKPETIRIYLLLGGEHDGAIYCTLSLVLATREIVESEGIYYSTVPSETTRTAAVLPTQHNLTNALVMLKKRVQAKLEEGFDLLPTHQLDIVEEMLQDLRKRLPHFSSPVTKPPRNSAIAAISTPIFSPPPNGMNYFIPSVNRVKSSQLRRQKLPPRSKAVPHRLMLPSNYQDLCTTWGISQHENYAWIHDINAASPLKLAIPTTKSVHAGHLSPLRVPLRHDTCS
ncbi:hypothetical protein PRIC2_004145 [Phytophthora ramorum]